MGVPNFDYGGSYKHANTINKTLASVLANAFYGLPLNSGCKTTLKLRGRERTILSGIRRKALDEDRKITAYGIYLLHLYAARNPLN